MEWTLRGWLWYLRGAVCRRFGPNKHLISSLLLVVICVSLLSGFHITFSGEHGEVILGNFERSLESSGQYDETELDDQNGNFDYIEDEEEPPMNSHGYPNISSKPLPLKNKRREPGSRNNLKKKKKKKQKGFKLNVNVKKGSIGSRTDKLMFPRSDSRTESRNQLLPLRNNQKTGPLNYQRDVIVGDNIEWTLEVEQARRRELRQRSLRVRRECEQDVRGRLSRKMGIVYEHLNWVTRYDLIWCPVFKAGSTTWMKNLLLLAGEKHFNGSLHHKAKSLYPAPTSPQRIQNLMDKSLKFMIVRHPFDRLLSAYRDKMLRVLKIDDPYRRLQLQILEKYRDIGSRRSPTETTKEQKEEEEQEQEKASSFGDSTKDIDHPTFLQFLYKVRDDMKFFWQILDGTVVDPHWTPYWYYCAPCQIHYDIIAKVETLDLDQEFLIRAANLQGILRNARTHASKFDGYTDSETAAARYFGEVPVELLKELEELYWPDFKLYGYTSEKYLQMAKSGA